jgi:hypothetical protein
MKLINYRRSSQNLSTLGSVLFTLLVASPVWAEKPVAPGQSAFEELPKETRELLEPFERHWDRIAPERRKRMLDEAQSSDPEERRKFKKRAEHFNNLDPQDRKRLRKAKRHFDRMPPHERANLRHHFDSMSPEEKRRLGESLRAMGSSSEKRNGIRDKVRKMSAEERRQYLHEIMEQGKKPNNEQ